MKKSIDLSDYYALHGVLQLAQIHIKRGEEFLTCAYSLLGLKYGEDGANRVEEMIWGIGEWNPDALLENLGITVDGLEKPAYSSKEVPLMLRLLEEIEDEAARDEALGKPMAEGAHFRAIQRAKERL